MNGIVNLGLFRRGLAIGDHNKLHPRHPELFHLVNDGLRISLHAWIYRNSGVAILRCKGFTVVQIRIGFI